MRLLVLHYLRIPFTLCVVVLHVAQQDHSGAVRHYIIGKDTHLLSVVHLWPVGNSAAHYMQVVFHHMYNHLLNLLDRVGTLRHCPYVVTKGKFHDAHHVIHLQATLTQLAFSIARYALFNARVRIPVDDSQRHKEQRRCRRDDERLSMFFNQTIYTGSNHRCTGFLPFGRKIN